MCKQGDAEGRPGGGKYPATIFPFCSRRKSAAGDLPACREGGGEGSDRYFHSVFRQNDLPGKFFAAFSKDVMTLKDGVEVSQEKFLA
jgi:hypothetical protein